VIRLASGRLRTLRPILVLIVASIAAAATATATRASESRWPIQGLVTECNGDVVMFSAMVNLEWGGASPPSGGVIQIGHQNLSELTAVNLTTGTTYHGTGNAGIVNTTVISTPDGGLIYRQIIRSRLQATEGDESFIFTLTYVVVVHPDGTSTVQWNPGHSDQTTWC
jgi:hypothetical protein